MEEEVDRQRWLAEVHRGGESSHKAVEPDKKKYMCLEQKLFDADLNKWLKSSLHAVFVM